jgi:hypothetical protein
MLSSLTNNGVQNVNGSSSRSSHYKSLFDTTVLPYNKTFNNCSNTLCYTASKGTFIYQPHTATGMVGTTAAARRARRRRV